MGGGRIGTILLGLALLATLGGCESGKLSKEIAAQRKTGDAAGARQAAIDALTDQADRMLVWRELAYCDEVLARDLTLGEDARVGYLLEGALIAAAVCGQNKGAAPDDCWGAVCAMLAADMQTCIVATLGGVKAHYRRESRRSPATTLGDARHDRLDDEPQKQLDPHRDFDVWRESDPAEVVAATRLYARVKPLSLRLPQGKGGPAPAETLSAVDELEQWASARNLQTATLTDLYRKGEADVAAAYAQALEDLQEFGYFQLSSMVHNARLEP